MSCHAAKALAVKTATDYSEAKAPAGQSPRRSSDAAPTPPTSVLLLSSSSSSSSSSPAQNAGPRSSPPVGQTQQVATTTTTAVVAATIGGDPTERNDHQYGAATAEQRAAGGQSGATTKRSGGGGGGGSGGGSGSGGGGGGGGSGGGGGCCYDVISKDEPLAVKKRRVIELKTAELLSNKEKYYENLGEVYFLKDGGQLMDLFGWRRRPPTALLEYVRARLLDQIEDEPQRLVHLRAGVDGRTIAVGTTPAGTPPATPIPPPSTRSETSRERRDSSLLPLLQQQLPSHAATAAAATTTTLTPTTSHTASVPAASGSGTAAVPADGRLSPPISVCSGDELAERAKHEAQVLQRVAALRKVGLWAQQRLPKVQEPARAKAHWDYLLEEMKWMSNDFAQERKLKKAVARKCARMCQKYHQEKELRAQRAERDEQQRIRKLAATIAKDVKTFWSNAEKLLEFRIHTKVAAKRKEALDLQLNLLVDRTEKFSHQIRDKLAVDTPSGTAAPSVADTMSDLQDRDNDDDFIEDSSEEDDEETIAKQEEREKVDHKLELNELEGDNELTVEELLAKYYSNEEAREDIGDRSATPSDESMEVDADEDDEENAADDIDDEDDDGGGENASADDDGETEPIEEQSKIADERVTEQKEQPAAANSSEQQPTVESNGGASSGGGSNSIDDDKKSTQHPANNDEDKLGGLTAVAEKFQPKGLDLATAQVQTPIPFLLKHTLREYQHVGLDWLVAMCEQKLNGILADEMGLGKTIQTISLLAHLAVERGVWGPHLVVVPTSVMLNWEMEFKKWCPGFKILTYYGSLKERKQKRVGWTKKNTFHVCITSYKLVIQDHAAFRRKQWYYLILDEAQNIKNFKSQRWQLLVNFQAERRLLLTGTPLQNTLMELWSLMHFLMPHLFESHTEFREWFSNPLTGMVEGSSEYNEALVKRLHRVLRPFLLRRLKSEVEKQMPQKYEHVLMCRLSKRQRFLYDDFMSRAKTRETLASGKLLSVLNVLMQLRKVCNHPALFEPRPISSPFRAEGLVYRIPSLLLHMENPLNMLFASMNLHLADLELVLTAFAAHRIKKFQTTPQYIESAESHPATPPRCPSGKIRLHIRTTTTPTTAQMPRPSMVAQVGTAGGRVMSGQLRATAASPSGQPQRLLMLGQRPDAGQGQTTHAQPVTFQLVQKGGQTTQLTGQQSPMTLHVQQATGARTTTGALHRIVQTTTGQHILLTTTTHQPASGGPPTTTAVGAATAAAAAAAAAAAGTIRPAGSLVRMPVSASTAAQLQASQAASALQAGGHPTIATTLQRPQSLLNPHKPVVTTVVASRPPTPVTAGTPPRSISTASGHVQALAAAAAKAGSSSAGSSPGATFLAATTASAATLTNVAAAQRKTAVPAGVSAAAAAATATSTSASTTTATSGAEKSPFYIEQLEKKRRAIYQAKLKLLGRVNNMRCAPGPMYGKDLIEAVSVMTLEDRVPPAPSKRVAPLQTPYPDEVPENAVQRVPYGTGVGYLYTHNVHTHTSWWSDTNALRELVPSPDVLWSRYEAEWNQFLCIHPRVSAPPIEMHASHPPPHVVNDWRHTEARMRQELRPKIDLLARIALRQQTQFPDRRLIQFDCGKLQTLDQLLVQLKSGGHRVLIFTQMARMLDVLEEFLTMHGHTYLRLDGATGIEQRQVLVERFNSDKRVFCFILSTRSGGVGLNLTGADTVVFYDSDWNPTMDAQAQDRCHRIGQTRDVHIYRLVSERTIEENILRKANQKRMLGELAIEGGNFTTSFFRSNTITDLFAEQNGRADSECKAVIKKEAPSAEDDDGEKPLTAAELRREQEDFERTLVQVEEEADAKAAKRARAEASADLAEFDEDIAYQENRGLGTEETEEERVLMSQLNSIEKYALRFLETLHDFEDLKQAEEQVEAQKREWMLSRLQNQKEREEALKESPPLISYKRPHSPQEVKFNGKPATTTTTKTSTASHIHSNSNYSNSNNNNIRSIKNTRNSSSSNNNKNNNNNNNNRHNRKRLGSSNDISVSGSRINTKRLRRPQPQRAVAKRNAVSPCSTIASSRLRRHTSAAASTNNNTSNTNNDDDDDDNNNSSDNNSSSDSEHGDDYEEEDEHDDIDTDTDDVDDDDDDDDDDSNSDDPTKALRRRHSNNNNSSSSSNNNKSVANRRSRSRGTVAAVVSTTEQPRVRRACQAALSEGRKRTRQGAGQDNCAPRNGSARSTHVHS